MNIDMEIITALIGYMSGSVAIGFALNTMVELIGYGCFKLMQLIRWY